MAPELVDRRASGYDSKVDMWSMGIVLFEMVVGRPPFQGTSHAELFSNIRDNRALDIPTDVIVSPELVGLLRKVYLQSRMIYARTKLSPRLYTAYGA